MAQKPTNIKQNPLDSQQNKQNFGSKLYNQQQTQNNNKKYVINTQNSEQVEQLIDNSSMIHSNVSNTVNNSERRYTDSLIKGSQQLNYYKQDENKQSPKQTQSSQTPQPRSSFQLTPLNRRSTQRPQLKYLPKPLTLALDIDLTLIYSVMGIDKFYDHQFTIKSGNYSASYSFNQRPGLNKFLIKLRDYYNLIIFTSAGQIYADKVLEYIDPNKEFFIRRFYQQNCVPASFLGQKVYVKDLTAISPITKNIILIDDNIFAGKNQPQNLIQCQPYKGNKDDRELDKLEQRLIKIYKLWKEKSSQDETIGVNRLINKVF